MKVVEIARLLGAELEGDGSQEVVGGALLEAASARDAAFVDSERHFEAARASAAGCLIAGRDFPALPGRAVIRVDRPRDAFARAMRTLHPRPRPDPGVHASAVVDPSALLGEGVSVGPHAEIGADARIGDGCVIGRGCSLAAGVELGRDGVLHPGVAIYPGVRIGERVVLHAGAVIGADGFGFVFEGDHYEKFPQLGGVRIGDDVEIGANSCVDRGALGDTELGDGVKLDNLVHIAHNCRIGRHVVIAAQTGLAGAVVVEEYAVLGGQIGIGDKARIGAKAVVGSGAGVLSRKTLASGGTYWGTPARPLRQYLKNLGRLDRLPKLLAEVEALRKRVRELEER